MRPADLIGPSVALAGVVVFGAALLAGPGRAAEPSKANREPVERLDVWRLVFCPRLPPQRGECRLADDVGTLSLGDCQDLARGAARALPPPAVAGCVVDGDALAVLRGISGRPKAGP